MSSVAFLVNTSFTIRANKRIENISETQNGKANSVCQCPLSDGIEQFTLSDESHLVESLQKYKESGSKDFGEFLDLFNEDLQRRVSNLFTESIDELDLDESEAEQYIKDFIEDDSREELDTMMNLFNINKHDVFDTIFEYRGWEIRDLTVSDDLDFPHDITISFLFDCNLNLEEVLGNLSESRGKEVPEECEALLANILEQIKSRYALQA